MLFNLFTLRKSQRVLRLIIITTMTLFQFVYASPGAHGPNGEHLDTSNKVLINTIPKFESFTETFELMGNLFEDKLVIYLHDFKTNTPIENANIEVESSELSASAAYSQTLKAYALTNQEMLKLLSKKGEHEITLTVMSDTSDDLLISHLTNIAANTENQTHNDEHHHDIPWSSIAIAILVFCAGFLLGRTKKERK